MAEKATTEMITLTYLCYVKMMRQSLLEAAKVPKAEWKQNTNNVLLKSDVIQEDKTEYGISRYVTTDNGGKKRFFFFCLRRKLE